MNNGLYLKYFVLNPTKADAYGVASRAAIRAYAESISQENAVLCFELNNWVKKIEAEKRGEER